MPKDNKEVIKKFLSSEDDIQNIVLHTKNLLNKEIFILDTGYKFLGIRVDQKRRLERYLDDNNIIEAKVKYTVTILLKILKNYILEKELSLLEEDMSAENNLLVDLLKEEIIDDKLLTKALFEFTCLSDKLDIYSDQVLNKEINSHNIKSALIKCTIKKAITEECKEVSFEIDKTSLGELIDSLQELHDKL